MLCRWLTQNSDKLLQIIIDLSQGKEEDKQTTWHHAEENIHGDRQLLFIGFWKAIHQSGGKVTPIQKVTWQFTLMDRMSVRRASHANSWYSGSASQLDRELSSWLSVVAPLPSPARAVICPHAGYSYSGPTAAYRSLDLLLGIQRLTPALCFSVSDRLTLTQWRQSSSWAPVTTWDCLAALWASVSRTKLPSEISPSTETSTRSSWTQVTTLTPWSSYDADKDDCRKVWVHEHWRRRGWAQHRDAAALHRQGDGAGPWQLHHCPRHGGLPLALLRG